MSLKCDKNEQMRWEVERFQRLRFIWNNLIDLNYKKGQFASKVKFYLIRIKHLHNLNNVLQRYIYEWAQSMRFELSNMIFKWPAPKLKIIRKIMLNAMRVS